MRKTVALITCPHIPLIVARQTTAIAKRRNTRSNCSPPGARANERPQNSLLVANGRPNKKCDDSKTNSKYLIENILLSLARIQTLASGKASEDSSRRLVFSFAAVDSVDAFLGEFALRSGDDSEHEVHSIFKSQISSTTLLVGP